MVNDNVESLIKVAEKHLDNVIGNLIEIELYLAKMGLDENNKISRESKEIRKYKQWIENIDKKFKEIDNHFKQIMGICADKYHKLLEELKRNRPEDTYLYRRVMEMYGIFEFLHKNGLSSTELLIKKFSDMFTEINRIKMGIGNNQNLRSLFFKYSQDINSKVSKRLKEDVIDRIVEIDNDIKNLISRIKNVYGHLLYLLETEINQKKYKNIAKTKDENVKKIEDEFQKIYNNITKAKDRLHKEIVELEKLHEDIKHLVLKLSNFEMQVVRMQ